MASKRNPPKPKAASVKGREDAAHRKKVFAEAYLSNGGNKTEAALAAGFSPKTAAQQGSRLFKSVEVKQLIEQARTRIERKVELGPEDLARAIRQSLLFDPRKLFREDGALKAIHELDEDTAMCLTGIEIEEIFADAAKEESQEPQPHGGSLKRAKRKVLSGRTVKLKWAEKGSARDQLARMLGSYEKDNRQRTDPLAELLREVMGKRTSVGIVPDDPAHRA